MQAIGIRAESIDSLKKEIQNNIQEGFNPTIATIFASVSADIEALQLSLKTQEFEIFGASSGGEILLSNDGLSIARASIVGLLIDLPAGHFSVAAFPENGDGSFSLGERAAQWAQEKFEHPAFLLLSAGLTADGEALIQGIQSISGKDTVIYGALAADDMMFQQTYVFDK